MKRQGIIIAIAAAILLLVAVASCEPDKSRAHTKQRSLADIETKKLFNAVEADDSDSIRAAVAAGARINEKRDEYTQGSQTPLMFASLTGKSSAVKTLLALKADANIGEKDGYTPLHGAAFQGRSEAARILLADLSVPNSFHGDGYAPIHRACWGTTPGHTDTVKEFLKAGVPYDLSTKTTPAKRPVDLTSNAATLALLKSWAQRASASTTGATTDDGAVGEL
jgi:ankyrin repeat protein